MLRRVRAHLTRGCKLAALPLPCVWPQRCFFGVSTVFEKPEGGCTLQVATDPYFLTPRTSMIYNSGH